MDLDGGDLMVGDGAMPAAEPEVAEVAR